jgi:hypothetical protein
MSHFVTKPSHLSHLRQCVTFVNLSQTTPGLHIPHGIHLEFMGEGKVYNECGNFVVYPTGKK